MTERLHQSFEQSRRFSTDVSHELRTPITAIRGQLEVALFHRPNARANIANPSSTRDGGHREIVEHCARPAAALASRIGATGLAESSARSRRGGLPIWSISSRFPPREKEVTLTSSFEAVRAARRSGSCSKWNERLLSNLLSNAVPSTRPRADRFASSLARPESPAGPSFRSRTPASGFPRKIYRISSIAFTACATRRPTRSRASAWG